MTTVIKFKRIKASRSQALNWLVLNSVYFPALSGSDPIGPDLFHGWRFVLSTDGLVYFANCIEAGITESELVARMAA